ncbi:MAG: type II toxin-antitoxin system RelE/ParE family toxin [Pseudomonadota bacterium]
MTKQLRFEAAARDQLNDIADWTADTFGPAQAETYERLILDRLAKLIDGTAFSKPILAGDTRRQLQAGQHILVFIERQDTIVVLAILHSHSDLFAHLPPTKDD